jgi:type IV secretory pathway component VirB8
VQEISQKEKNFNPYNFKISSYKIAYKGKIKGAFD